MQSLVGMWKLVEVRPFDDVGRDQVPPLGTHPMGIMIFEANYTFFTRLQFFGMGS